MLSQYHCSAADSTILVMKDGVCELGYAAIDLIQGKLLIRNIFLTNGSAQELNAENKIYIDFLMRAAASYGANHGAYQMENCVEELHSFFCFQRVCFGAWNMYHSISKIVQVCNPHHT